MKVRWREHEMIMVAVLILWQLMITLSRLGTTNEDAISAFAVQFKQSGVSFDYWRNLLLPHAGSLLLIYSTYMLVNLLLLPAIKKMSSEDFYEILSIRFIKPFLLFLLVGYFLAIGANIISFYGRPHLFNYWDYQFVALMGFNDKPMSNLLFGFERALGVVAVIATLVGLRELFIWLIEKPTGKREYRIMITNNATPLLLFYFVVLSIINPLHHDFLKYVVFVTPLLFLYLYLIFGLFPFKEGKTFVDKAVLLRLVLVTFICTIPAILLFLGHRHLFIPLMYWLLMLFVITPICWIIYGLRRDSILQFMTMETALAKSHADLNFLKSQINPHFLFNALNTLYGTALKGDMDKTAEGIQRLGDMMRFMLHQNTQDFIPIEKELEYLRNFIVLQKLRIQPSTNILIEDEIDVHAPVKIAPMLLIPFVENAFKHGISQSERSWIKIDLRCDNNVLNFEVRNSIHKNDEDTGNGKSGIGLMNVKNRLKLQYADSHILSVNENEDEFVVKLILKC